MRNLLTAMVVAVGLALAGCADSFVPGLEEDASAADRLLGMEVNYATAFVFVTKYENLPRCSNADAPVACSSQSVVDNMRKAHRAAKASLDAAWAVVRNVKASESAKDAAIAAAAAAVANAQKLFDAYKPIVEGS